MLHYFYGRKQIISQNRHRSLASQEHILDIWVVAWLCVSPQVGLAYSNIDTFDTLNSILYIYIHIIWYIYMCVHLCLHGHIYIYILYIYIYYIRTYTRWAPQISWFATREKYLDDYNASILLYGKNQSTSLTKKTGHMLCLKITYIYISYIYQIIYIYIYMFFYQYCY